jgi:hypothetical protein
VIVEHPGVAGASERTAVVGSSVTSVSPSGSPGALNVYGAVPPLAVMGWLKAHVFGRSGGERTMAPQMMIVYDRMPKQPCESVALTVKSYRPGDVGVPDNAPEEESVNPGGGPAGAHPERRVNVYGAMPPLAVIVVWL